MAFGSWFYLLVTLTMILDEIPEEVVVLAYTATAGTADFLKICSDWSFIYSAGFSDGSVFLAAQSRSFPSIMASKMSVMLEEDAFTQPLVSDNMWEDCYSLGGTQIANARLFFNGAGPAVLPGTPTTEVSNILTGPFNNMGVPGAKSFHYSSARLRKCCRSRIVSANPYLCKNGFESSEQLF